MSAAAPSEATDACWRCGTALSRDAPSCIRCRAPRRRLPLAIRQRAARSGAAEPVSQVIAVYVVMLACSLAYGVLTRFGMEGGAGDAREGLLLIVGLEVVHTALVAFAWWRLPPPVLEEGGSVSPAAAWALSLPVVLGVLAANAGYHALLRSVLHVARAGDPLLASGVTPLAVGAYCLQPAIVEEVFFRSIVLDRLHAAVGVHAAVALSSLMFGLVHIGVPLSIPILIVLGLTLGYARVASRGVVLPIAMHAAHNAIVMALS